MDPQLKNILTTIGMTVSTSAATWAAGHGIINSSDEGAFANILVSVLLFAITAVLGWYAQRKVSPTAAIQQVNSQKNGVAVVPEAEARAAGIQPVNQPMIGAK